MILVDTSVWIAILRGEINVDEDDYENLCTCGPIVQEVLQGFESDEQLKVYSRLFVDLLLLSDTLPVELFRTAADIYRQGRRRGLTIRSTIDCLVAAIALKNDVPVWHRDRDFDYIAQFTNLKIHRFKRVH